MKLQQNIVLLFCVSVVFAGELPSSFQRCKRVDSACMINAINGALRYMKNGIPQFGILPIDPLTVNTLSIDQGSQSSIKLKQDFKNVKLSHLAGSSLTMFKFTNNNYIINAEAITPFLEFYGDYKMDGRVLLLPVVGQGISNVTIHGLRTKHEAFGELLKNGDETYLRIKKYNVKFEEPQFMSLHFDNLFNGDKVLGDTMNRVINENWRLMFKELCGAYEDTFGYIFRDITNKIFLKVPMNKVFLEQ